MAYSERVIPSIWMFLASALLIPGGLLVFLPVSVPAAIIAATVFFASACTALIASAPVIEVEDGVLRAGRARISVNHIATATSHRGDDATAERGVRLDARAHLVIRGWADPVVKVTIDDPSDPVPYWLISTRRPEELVTAIEAGRNARS